MEEESKEENNTVQTEATEKRNDWKIFSGILGVVIIILLVVIFYGRITGNVVNVVSEDDVGTRVVDFAKSQGIDATVVKIDKQGALYEVVLLMQGKEVPVYVTGDGENLIPSLIPLTGNAIDDTDTSSAPKEVSKSDKPKVEAYIFSYCPYGIQFEKALIPVYDLLKNKADINIVAIGAMHGEYEKTETLRQICVEKLYGKDKLFKYLKAFDENAQIGSCGGTASCVDPLIAKIYSGLGIDKSRIDSCMKTDAKALYDAQGAKASGLGIGGSPTFVINGVQVQVDRTPDAIKEAVCNAFNTKPSECSQKLPTASASAGFGTTSSESVVTNAHPGGQQC